MKILRRKSMLAPLLILFLLAHFTAACFSQILPFNHYSIKDGLPSNWVTTIFQDSRGYLWIGGDGGMAVYDGIRFKVYGVDDGLPVGHVWSIAESRTSPGRIYIGTHEGGLTTFQDGAFQTIRLGQQNSVNTLFEDIEGVIWCGTANGVWRIQNSSPALFPTAGSEHQWAPFVVQTRDSLIWISHDSLLFRYSPRTRQTEPLVINKAPSSYLCLLEDEAGWVWIGTSLGTLYQIKNDRVVASRKIIDGELRQAIDDGEGNLWIATSNGVIELAKNDFPNGEPVHYTTVNGLPDLDITSCLVDHEKNLWFGTRNGGLSRLSERSIFTIPLEPFDGVRGNAAAAGGGGHLYVASGRGLYEVWKKRNGIWQTHLHDRSRLNVAGRTAAVEVGPDSMIWLASEEGAVQGYAPAAQSDGPAHLRLTQKLQGHAYPASIMVDRNNRLWFSRNAGRGVAQFELGASARERVYTQKDGLPEGTIQAMLLDRNGDLWFGAFRRGISVFQPQGGRYVFRRTLTEQDGLADLEIRSLLQRRNGEIWIGHRFKGISIYKNGAVETLSTKDGLLSNAVWALAEDEQGRVWIGTSTGIQYTAPDDPRRIFTHRHLIGRKINTIGVIAGRQTVYAVSPGELMLYEYGRPSSKSAPPPVYVTGIRVNGRGRPMHSGMRFVHNQNFCEISFNGISFKIEALKFKYRMLGLQETWHGPVAQREVVYGSLQPGDYTFEVTAINADGVESAAPASLSFTILPPWYRTWWAMMLYVIFGAGSVVAYGKMRTRQLRKRSRELRALVHERTTEVRAQRNRLQEQSEKLLELDRLKSRFFANISHEFRTPLTLILGLLDKFIEKTTEAGRLADYQVMQRNAARLLRLINQLLDISKLEAGRIQLRAERGDLAGYVRHLVISFASLAEQKKIDLTFNGAPLASAGAHTPIIAWFDHDHLEKVFYNLLSNAFKFTPEKGRIAVSIGVGNQDFARTSEKTAASPIPPSAIDECIEISVTNTGRGIPPEKLPYVFGRFYQVEDSATRQFEGSGIGLALVKELVELHHGHISVKSLPDQETTFTVRLPLGSRHLQPEEIVESRDVHVTREQAARLDDAHAPALQPPIDPGSNRHSARTSGR